MSPSPPRRPCGIDTWQFYFEPTESAQDWADYCNHYQDLKNAFCGGGTCTTNNWWACRTHCYQYGFTEGRPIAYSSGNSCTGKFNVAKAESYSTGKRMFSPYGDWCVDMNLQSSTLFMHPCHNGNNQKFYWDTQ